MVLVTKVSPGGKISVPLIMTEPPEDGQLGKAASAAVIDKNGNKPKIAFIFFMVFLLK